MVICKILKNKQGISLVVVLCMTALLMTIGASVLVSASNSSSAAKAQKDSTICENYAKEFAKYFTSEVIEKSFEADGKPENETNPFVIIPQSIYDKNKGKGGTKPIVLKSKPVEAYDPTLDEVGVSLNFALQSAYVRIASPYRPEIEVGGIKIVDESLEEVDVSAQMTVTITAQYKGQSYVVYCDYLFEGMVKDIKRSSDTIVGEPKVSQGKWTLEKYRQ